MASASRSLVHKFRIRELKRALSSDIISSSGVAVKNPFLPQFNEATGRWAPPRYSLRRQAELIKKGRLEGTLHLLPPGPKLSPAEIPAPNQVKPKRAVGKNKEAVESGDKLTIDIAKPINWIGEAKVREVAGADIGNRLYAGKKQMFKGHRWERVKKMRRAHRRALMRSMKKRILRWRLVRVGLQI
jgi:large subunit ribosomal protein L25